MLRTQIVSVLRHDTSIFIPMFFNNLHISHIERNAKRNKNKNCEAIPIAVVSIVLRFTFYNKKKFYIINKSIVQKYLRKIYRNNLCTNVR